MSLNSPNANLIRGNSTAAASVVICYAPRMITTDGFWQGVNPFDYALPLFIMQMIIVVTVTRIVVFFLKPFHQPRVIGEIISGIILGPSGFGKIKNFPATLFPPKSLLVLETMAHLGLIYYMFLVGVEMDLNMFRRMGKKSLPIAAVGIVLPFTIGSSTSFLLAHQLGVETHRAAFCLFLGVCLSVTAFPVLARILAETKLLNSDLGRIAMSSAIINDLCAWFLLALSVSLLISNASPLPSLWVLLSGIGFVVVSFYTVRPAMWWVVRRIPDGEGVTDFQVCCIMAMVMIGAFITDGVGLNAVFGAFIFGLMIPSGMLGVALVEKLEDFVVGILLPQFLVLSGLKTNLYQITDPVKAAVLILVFVLSSAGKIIGTIGMALLYNMPFHEGISLGFLMNTKGLIEMIILNIGRDTQVLDDELFAVFILASLVMTSLVTPVVTMTHRSSRRLIGYKRRNLQRWSNPESELRLLACVHNTRHVPSIISLLDASNPTKRSPIFVYALHLVELTGRASAMLVVHNATAKPGRRQAQSDHIFAAFESYEQHAGGVSVQTLTAVSPFATMHEDVCGLAEDKHVAVVVLPFHKHQTVDGGMEPTNPAIRVVNESVLAAAPCSVAVLVDRGLSAAATRGALGQAVSHNVAVLFFGGPHDREALAYAWRMAENPGVSLAVLRFIPVEQSRNSPGPGPGNAGDPRTISIVTNERQQDEEYLKEFRQRKVDDEAVTYAEAVVCNGEETVTAIRTMDCVYDLYIVGREQTGEASVLTAGLTEFTECPELGAIGDLLTSSDFASTVSVLVMQQYVSPQAESPRRKVEHYQRNADRRARSHMETAPGPQRSWHGRY